MSTAAQKRARRRRVLPGYPIDKIFETPEELKEYFSGDKILCLECGKSYRGLGIHLIASHEIEPDDYRREHGIPWTYGLSCAETKKLKREIGKNNVKAGIFKPSKEQAELARKSLKDQRERVPIREVLTKRNLDLMNEGKSGEEAERRKRAPKKGTLEYRQMMGLRLQCQPEVIKERFTKYWTGRTQSIDHKNKRIYNSLLTRHGREVADNYLSKQK